MSEMWDITYGGMLERAARLFPMRNAVKYTDRDYERTYRELDEECDIVARGLMAMGIKKGDNVAIWASNIPQWIITLFATAKIGAILVTVNTSYKVFELQYLLQQSDSKCLIMADGFKGTDYMEVLNELCPTLRDSKPGELNEPMLPFLKTVIYCGQKRIFLLLSFQYPL